MIDLEPFTETNSAFSTKEQANRGSELQPTKGAEVKKKHKTFLFVHAFPMFVLSGPQHDISHLILS